ncbi:autotransporter outer membrane beta-barrel domain-containing protein [Acinetobacter brisouii]
MNNPVNIVSQKQKVRHQQGFASLLFVLLIGLSLVIIVLGAFITLRGLQDSAITSHAQTQAEERSMIGVKALSKFLYNLNSTQIAALQNGTITDKNGTLTGTAGTQVALYARHTETPPTSPCYFDSTTQYCFDVTASSGGASATIRTVYQKASTVSKTILTGSVFAGGLLVGGHASFTGDTSSPISIAVGGTNAGQICQNSVSNCNAYTASQLANMGLTVSTYQSVTYVSANDLKEYANYQFTSSGCYKLNFYTSTGDVMSKTALTSCSGLGVTSNSDGTWSIADPKNLPIGVLWFDNNVALQLVDGSTLVNTIITTGTLYVNPPSVTGNDTVTVNSYAPYWYYSSVSPGSTTSSTGGDGKVCGASAQNGITTIPSQYCNYASYNSNATPTFKTSSLTGIGSIANILFLTDSTLTLDAGNSKKLILNFYGNLIASNGSGGTGNASGKFAGSGSINITGNLIMAGSTDTTELTGNVKLDLSQSTAANSSVIPSITYANSLRFIKYM